MAEQALGLVIGEGGRRLVQDQHAGLLRQGAGDDHELLRGEIERAHRRPRIDGERELTQRALRRGVPGRRVDQAEARGLGMEIHVLRDAEIGRDIDLLRDQRDAGRLGRGDAARTERLPVEADLAVIAAGRVDAGKDLDQGRLAGPVLAEQGDDLARLKGQLATVDRKDAREALGQGPRHQQWRGPDLLLRGCERAARHDALLGPADAYPQVGFWSGTFL